MSKDFYYTNSLNLAAYLLYKGVNMVSKFNTNGKYTYIFERNELTKEAVINYNKEDILKQYLSCYKRVKEA